MNKQTNWSIVLVGFCWLTVFWLMAGAFGVRAETSTSLIVSQSYYEDPTGKLTFADVRDRAFTPYTGILTKGYTPVVYWIKLRIDPSKSQSGAVAAPDFYLAPSLHHAARRASDLAVRIRPPYLDDIRLYDPLEPSRGERKTGDRTPWIDDELLLLNFGFLLPRGDQPRDIWLRVQSTSTMIVDVAVHPYEVMLALERRQELINNLDVVLILFFMLLGIMLYFSRPDRVVLAYVVVMVVSFFHATNFMGYYRIFFGDLLPIGFTDQLHSVLIFLVPAAYMFFNRQLLKEYQPKAWMMWLLLPGQYYFVFGLILLVLGYAPTALWLNAALAAPSLLWVCIILLFGIRSSDSNSDGQPSISRFWLLPYYLVLTISFSLLTLSAQGLMDALSGAVYRNIIHGAISFGSLAMIVFWRGRRLEQRRQLQLAQAQQAAEFEKAKRAEQTQFFSMLTHEIRTPLTVMTYAAQTSLPSDQLRQHIADGIREIDEIIERCVQADRADQVNLPLDMRTVSIESFLDDIIERFNADHMTVDCRADKSQTLSTDPVLLQIVLGNLVGNALKYAPKEAEVVLQIDDFAKNARHGILFRVTNPVGPTGFPEPHRVFDKYYRAPRARNTTGSGLGLFVAKSFAHKLGGTLTYHPSEINLCFELWVPLRMS